MRNLLTIPTGSKKELHPLKEFLLQYPDAEYDGDRLVAYTEHGDEIDFISDLHYHIEDYLENDEIDGIEVVDRMGGHRLALEEIKEGNV